MSKCCIFVTWNDVPHLPEEERKAILGGIPAWQRESRTEGIPQLGSGAIYQVSLEDVIVTGFELPKHWPRCFGMDVGWNRTAVLWGAYDRETSTLYVYDEYYRGQAEPSVHAAAILQRGKWVPGVIDPASRGRMQTDGSQLLSLYQELGLKLDVAKNAREAGIYAVWEMLSQGRLKIFKGCTNTISEYRLYRRDEKGQVVKKMDHLMDALRYLVMSGIEQAKCDPGQTEGQWWAWTPPAVWAG